MTMPESASIPVVLVVDDEPAVRQVLREYLEGEGYTVWDVGCGEEALRFLEERGIPHVALIDVRMPGENGLDLARSIKQFCDLPILMVSGVADTDIITAALNEVAEDYVIKPVERSVLVARVGCVLRRISDPRYLFQASILVGDSLTLELTRRRAVVNGREVALTPTESKILHILVRSGDRPVRTQFLLQRLWPLDEVFEDTLRVHVSRLRKKIEPDPKRPRHLLTARGIGYRLVRSPSA